MKKGWQKKKLDEVCEIEYGTRVVQKRDGGTTYPVYGGGGATFSMDSFNREDRVVVARFGMSEQCTRFVSGKFFLNDSGLTMSPKNLDTLLPAFLDKWLFSSNDEIFAIGKGTAQKNLDVAAFRCLQVPLPPLPEQKRIVAILDKAFTAISTAKANAEKNLANARELFESYLQDIFANPGEGWEEKSLEEIGKTQTGTTPKTSDKENYGNYIPFITPADIDIYGDGRIRYRDEGLSEQGLKNGRKMEKNSILMVCIGASIGKVGYVNRDVSCNQQINSLTVKKGFCPKYFYYALSTKGFFEQVIKKSAQATLPIINKGKWQKLSISYPFAKEEQESIVTKLDKLSSETKKLETIYQQKLADLEELKKSVLQKAFNGELPEVKI